MSKAIPRPMHLRSDLPFHLTRKIGQIITKYAFLDYQLRMLVWRLTGVDEKVGRLAVRDPRATDKLLLCRDLLFVRGVTIADAKFNDVLKLLQKVENYRDLLAHGVWTEHDGIWSAVYFKGNINDQTLHPLARKRALRPEAIKVAQDDRLVSLLDAVETLMESIDSFWQTLPEKPPEQSAPKGHQSKRRGSAKPKPPRQSSRG